jgi:hypothetical protein
MVSFLEWKAAVLQHKGGGFGYGWSYIFLMDYYLVPNDYIPPLPFMDHQYMVYRIYFLDR